MRLLPLVALTLLAACSTVPGTNRKQLLMTSAADEMALGQEGYAEALKGAKLIHSGPQYEMVQRLGQAIAQAAVDRFPARCADFEWEIALVDEPKTVNAWCMPGGKMAVYTGLLPVTQDEAGLAVVVGHEVAHAVARHGGERMSQSMAAEVLLGIADVSLHNMDPGEKDTVMTALIGAGTLGVLYPYSRVQESEADEMGLEISAWAGYDPRAAIGLWTRMGQTGGDKPPELFSTHPSDASRLEHMKDLMPKMLNVYEQGRKEASGASKKVPQTFVP